MKPLLFAILLFLSVALGVWGVAWIILSGRQGDRRRLKHRLGVGTRHGGPVQEQAMLLRLRSDHALAELLGRYHFFQELRASLKQSMPDVMLGRFMAVTAGIAAVSVVAGFLLTESLTAAAITGLIGLYLPFLYVERKRTRRQRLLSRQLPDGLDFLARALRAGHTLPVGLQMLGAELPEPLCDEFARCHDEVSLGCNPEDALRDMTERVESTDFAFFVTAVLVQRQTGGDLAQVLDNITGMLRQRMHLQHHVRAKTAEGRFTGYVLAAFPMVMFLILYVMNQQYAELLVVTPAGNVMLGSALALSAIGLWVIKRITTVAV